MPAVRAPKSSPVPIRFEPSTRERLQSVADAAGLNVSDLCRLAVERFLADAERTGKITLTLAPSKKSKRKGKGKYRS